MLRTGDPNPYPKAIAYNSSRAYMEPDRQPAYPQHDLGLGGNERLPAVNSKKTIFMKREGGHFIFHCLFLDDMMHTTTSTKFKDEFLTKYSKDFKITGGCLMKTFLGMELEQDNKTIKFHLDQYVHEMLAEYKN